MEQKSQMEQDVEKLNQLSYELFRLTNDPQYGMMSWFDTLSSNMSELKQLFDKIGVK